MTRDGSFVLGLSAGVAIMSGAFILLRLWLR